MKQCGIVIVAPTMPEIRKFISLLHLAVRLIILYTNCAVICSCQVESTPLCLWFRLPYCFRQKETVAQQHPTSLLRLYSSTLMTQNELSCPTKRVWHSVLESWVVLYQIMQRLLYTEYALFCPNGLAVKPKQWLLRLSWVLGKSSTGW